MFNVDSKLFIVHLGNSILSDVCSDVADCLETSVRNYRHKLRNNPEERSSHPLRGGSLKSRSVLLFGNQGLDTGATDRYVTYLKSHFKWLVKIWTRCFLGPKRQHVYASTLYSKGRQIMIHGRKSTGHRLDSGSAP